MRNPRRVGLRNSPKLTEFFFDSFLFQAYSTLLHHPILPARAICAMCKVVTAPARIRWGGGGGTRVPLCSIAYQSTLSCPPEAWEGLLVTFSPSTVTTALSAMWAGEREARAQSFSPPVFGACSRTRFNPIDISPNNGINQIVMLPGGKHAAQEAKNRHGRDLAMDRLHVPVIHTTCKYTQLPS
jgi:hypothetical protein